VGLILIVSLVSTFYYVRITRFCFLKQTNSINTGKIKKFDITAVIIFVGIIFLSTFSSVQSALLLIIYEALLDCLNFGSVNLIIY
jgi:NADH:ubiquinone oxidoreductase subunit 2 (subunit N)